METESDRPYFWYFKISDSEILTSYSIIKSFEDIKMLPGVRTFLRQKYELLKKKIVEAYELNGVTYVKQEHLYLNIYIGTHMNYNLLGYESFDRLLEFNFHLSEALRPTVILENLPGTREAEEFLMRHPEFETTPERYPLTQQEYEFEEQIHESKYEDRA